jgi:GT2 family glycosyltransferase
MDVTIVIPLFNQLSYTKSCLDSLRATVGDKAAVLVIDNGSTDGTMGYLRGGEGISVIGNEVNLGCAGAWNQGVRETRSEWVVILNNDVIVSSGWLTGLLAAAEREGLDVVSPGIREGENNYDIESYAQNYVERMKNAVRRGVADGICFMVRRRVFETIGLFDENFRIGQFEDTDFFRRARSAGFRLGTTGGSFIHHFGSVTQKALGQGRVEKPYVAENRAYYRKKWRMTWWKRFWLRRRLKLREFVWRTREKTLYGHTLREKWLGGRLRYY